MDRLAFEQLSTRINEAKTKNDIAFVMQTLALMPIDGFRVALEGSAAKKLKQLTENK